MPRQYHPWHDDVDENGELDEEGSRDLRERVEERRRRVQEERRRREAELREESGAG